MTEEIKQEKKIEKKPEVEFTVDLEEMIFGGKTLEEEFTVGKHKLKVRTLTGAEREEIIDRTSIRSASNLLDKIELARIPTLARSIVSINGVPWSSRDEIRKIMEEKPRYKLNDAIEEFLGKVPLEILNLFYELYSRVTMKERQAIDELKKDLPSLPSEIGGEYAGISAIQSLTRIL